MLRGRPFARRHAAGAATGTAPTGFGLRQILLTNPPLIYLDTSRPGTITQAGGLVSDWADPDAVLSATAAGAARPAYSASDANFNNQPSITGDGAANIMAIALTRPAPSVQPTFILGVIRPITHTSGDVIWGASSGSNVLALRQNAASPNLGQANTTIVNALTTVALGSSRAVCQYFSNSVSDFQRDGSGAKVTGSSAGDFSAANFNLFAHGGAGFANVAMCLFCICTAEPTPGEYSAALAYCNTTFGTPL